MKKQNENTQTFLQYFQTETLQNLITSRIALDNCSEMLQRIINASYNNESILTPFDFDEGHWSYPFQEFLKLQNQCNAEILDEAQKKELCKEFQLRFVWCVDEDYLYEKRPFRTTPTFNIDVEDVKLNWALREFFYRFYNGREYEEYCELRYQDGYEWIGGSNE